MDLGKFSNELQKAGLTVTEDSSSERFESYDDLCLPFLSTSHFSGGMVAMRELKDANYIYRSKEPISKEDFIKKCEVVKTADGSNDPAILLKEWMIDHIDKVYLINMGGSHLTSEAERFGVNVNDWYTENHECDTEYGFCCLGFYVYYDNLDMNLKIQMNNSYELARYLSKHHGISADFYALYRDGKLVEILEMLEKVSEFIPLFINKYAFSWFTNAKNEDTTLRSSYGKNILSNEGIMRKLKENPFYKYNKNNFIINPNKWYFIMANKNYVWLVSDHEKNGTKKEKRK